MIRSRILNFIVLVIGGFCIFLSVSVVYEFIVHFRFGWYAVYDILRFLLLSSLGMWCILGACKNFAEKKQSSNDQSSEDSKYKLARWHLLTLASIGLLYLLIGLSYWRFDFPAFGIIKLVHYVFVVLFALIPITVIAHFAKKA